MELTPEEKALAAQIHFEEDVLASVKQATGGQIELLAGADDKPPTVPARGLVAVMAKDRTTDERKIDHALRFLRTELQPRGYLAFVAERNYGSSPDRLGVLQTRDQFALLEFVQTGDYNSDLEHGGVVARIREWDEKYGVEILGAADDSADVAFRQLPADMLLFAREVSQFCPDIMEGYAEAVIQQWQVSAPEFPHELDEGDEEMDEETSARNERLALQMLAQDIQQAKRVRLWWD